MHFDVDLTVFLLQKLANECLGSLQLFIASSFVNIIFLFCLSLNNIIWSQKIVNWQTLQLVQKMASLCLGKLAEITTCGIIGVSEGGQGGECRLPVVARKYLPAFNNNNNNNKVYLLNRPY